MTLYKEGVESDIDPEHFGRVAVLLGGGSAERHVSLASGRRVLESLQRSGISACAIDPIGNWVPRLVEAKPDRAFIILHGPGGEDGAVQGVLEHLDIPYTGSDILSSALAMDKYRCKLLWQSVGLATPEFILVDDEERLGFCEDLLPGFMKPCAQGSSFGVSKVYQQSELYAAWQESLKYSCSVLFEQAIEGREFTVTVLNGKVLPAIRVECDETFYDFESKYGAHRTHYHLPSGLDPDAEQELQAMALTAFEILGCNGWGRLDLMQDEKGNFWLLEVNTVPGMTESSLVPMSAEAAGLSFDCLVLEVLRSSFSPEQLNRAVLRGKEWCATAEAETTW